MTDDEQRAWEEAYRHTFVGACEELQRHAYTALIRPLEPALIPILDAAAAALAWVTCRIDGAAEVVMEWLGLRDER